MPYFRGIEVFIVAGPQTKKLLEYPHPDGSSVRLMRVGAGISDLRSRGQLNQSSPASSGRSDADPTRQKKINPTTSVYIPSRPGDQFRLRYVVNQPSPPSRFIFFKMSINGHHTVSWGIDSDRCSSGSVSRSLYEPGILYTDRNGDPAVGIETRYFHFRHGTENQSVAEDGGLIELQVFRCRGRKRIAAELDSYPHRHQERYGITAPSGGLVENPQDCAFYEYHLEDAKDSPYATFCFHYRSTKYLEQLSIIPQRDTRPRPASMNPSSTPGTRSTEVSSDAVSPTFAHQFAFGVESLDMRVFDNSIKTTGVAASGPSEDPGLEEYSLKNPPQLPPATPVGAVEDSTQVQRKETMADLLQRPLPELPRAHSRHVSEGSTRSNCPSLTPSLKRYVDSEDFEKEEIEFITAQPLVISESMQALEVSPTNSRDLSRDLARDRNPGHEDSSYSDYAASPSPSSAGSSQSPVLPSPEGYAPTTGSVLERHLNQWDSPIAQSSPKSKAKLPSSKSDGALLSSSVPLPPAAKVTVTESEWLRRTPSPEEGKSGFFKRLWSPRPKRRSGRSSMVELPGRNEDHFKDKKRLDDKVAVDDSHVSNGTRRTGEFPVGNWI